MGVAGPNWSYINNAYLQWAGITAGIKASYFDYIGGGETWFNMISPEHTGTGIPLFAYTATFGGGFSATVSLEEPATVTMGSARQVFDGGLQTFYDVNGATYVNTALGTRAPDIVGALDLTQAWGTAHLAGVAHEANIQSPGGFSDTNWGYAVLGGIGFNLPQLGAGDVVKLQAAYSTGAIGYSGFTTAGWGQGDNGVNINGNGMIYSFADGVQSSVNGAWAKPTTWEVGAVAELHLTPQFAIDPEISYGSLTWSNKGSFTTFEGDMDSWMGGAVFTWAPVTNLSFNLEAVYQYTEFKNGSGAYAVPGVPTNASGFNGRVRVERDF